MTLMPKDVTIRMEQRKIGIRLPDGSERLGIFHKWSEVDRMDYALVENTDGGMEYIPVHRIRFLPMGNEVPRSELEHIFRQHGILKG